MPYLSKVRINPMRAAGRRMLTNPHLVHGMVMHGIPETTTGERALWRLDIDQAHQAWLLILTNTKPDWTHIVEQAGWPHADGEHFLVRDYQPLLAQLAIGRQFAFRLTANPVQNTRTPDKRTPTQQHRHDAGATRGIRTGHRTAASQLEWLTRRIPAWGCDLPTVHLDTGHTPDVRITARHTRRFRKHDNAGDVTLTTVTFDGRLTVTDPAKLTEKLLSGVGPAKAYGCGLLTLAPLASAAHG